MDTCNTSTCSGSLSPKDLRLNKTIFLSHSGCDKPFVDKLYTALLNRNYDAFFDKESLPKAEVINMKNIMMEVKKCKLCVFVLSEAFFTHTKNPMLEFMSFLENRGNDDSKRLLPLFYKLNVEEFKDEGKRQKRKTKWKQWAQEGSKLFHIDPERWEGALNVLSETSGIERIRSCEDEQYIEQIVSAICKIIPPDNPYEVLYGSGEDRMAKFVDDLYAKHEECGEHEPSRVCILGMHGMGGLGKTTLSKFVWNFFWSEFEGRVFRVELNFDDSKDSCPSQRMFSVLEKLPNIPKQLLGSLNVDRARRLYLRNIGQKRVVLIIDNASSECMDEILTYLQGVKFHPGSRVLILSRSKTHLEEIAMELKTEYPNFHIVEMVSLTKTEAEDIFLARAQVSREQLTKIQETIMRGSIDLCYFNGFYHPMVVHVLASRIKQENWDTQFLSKYRTGERGKTVIKLLKKSFDTLQMQTKKILLDLALYLPSPDRKWDPLEWLSAVNGIEQSEVEYELSELRKSAFLCEEDLAVHELVKELAIVATGDWEMKGCVFFDGNNKPWARIEDSDAVHVQRLGMENCEAESSMMNLNKCRLLRAVKIKNVTGLQKIQMPQNIVSFRSLEVSSSSEFMEGFRGDWNSKSKKPCIQSIVIEVNGNLNSLKWMSTENCRVVNSVDKTEFIPTQFQSLVYLRMLVGLEDISIPWQVLHKTLHNLKELEFGGFHGGAIIQVPEFPKLRKLHLSKCLSTRELYFVSLPAIENLQIHWAPALTLIAGLENCSSSLKHLDMFGCSSLRSEFLDLSSLCHLSDLKIWYCKSLERLEGLEKLGSLTSLNLNCCSGLRSLLDGVNPRIIETESGLSQVILPHLQAVSILGCSNLKSMEGIKNMMSIRYFEYSEPNGYIKDVMDMWDLLLQAEELLERGKLLRADELLQIGEFLGVDDLLEKPKLLGRLKLSEKLQLWEKLDLWEKLELWDKLELRDKLELWDRLESRDKLELWDKFELWDKLELCDKLKLRDKLELRGTFELLARLEIDTPKLENPELFRVTELLKRMLLQQTELWKREEWLQPTELLKRMLLQQTELLKREEWLQPTELLKRMLLQPTELLKRMLLQQTELLKRMLLQPTELLKRMLLQPTEFLKRMLLQQTELLKREEWLQKTEVLKREEWLQKTELSKRAEWFQKTELLKRGVLIESNKFQEQKRSREAIFFNKINVSLWKREYIASVISDSKTLPVAPIIPFKAVLKFLLNKSSKRSIRSSCGFLKMIIVSICQSSESQREHITRLFLNNIATMSRFLSSIQPLTLLLCLAYLRCGNPTMEDFNGPLKDIDKDLILNDFYFDMLLQMAGGMDAIFESWIQLHSHSDPTNNIQYTSKTEHGLLLLVITGFISPENCPYLATKIAKVYSSILLVTETIHESYMLQHLPPVAIDALSRLLIDKNIQSKIKEMNGPIHNIQALSTRLQRLRRRNLHVHRNNLLTEIFEDINT